MALRLGRLWQTRSQRRDRPGLSPEFPVRRQRKRRAADHQRPTYRAEFIQSAAVCKVDAEKKPAAGCLTGAGLPILA